MLIENGLIKKRNPEVISMEFYSPFYMFHTVHRNEDELIKLFTEHVEYFFENNIINE